MPDQNIEVLHDHVAQGGYRQRHPDEITPAKITPGEAALRDEIGELKDQRILLEMLEAEAKQEEEKVRRETAEVQAFERSQAEEARQAREHLLEQRDELLREQNQLLKTNQELKEKLEKQRLETAKVQAERERQEQEYVAAVKAERERQEQERLASARAQAERERQEQDRLAAVKAERERQEQERLAAAKTQAERERQEQDRLAAVKAEQERQEQEHLAAAKAQAERETQDPDLLAAVEAEQDREKERRQAWARHYGQLEREAADRTYQAMLAEDEKYIQERAEKRRRLEEEKARYKEEQEVERAAVSNLMATLKVSREEAENLHCSQQEFSTSMTSEDAEKKRLDENERNQTEITNLQKQMAYFEEKIRIAKEQQAQLENRKRSLSTLATSSPSPTVPESLAPPCEADRTVCLHFIHVFVCSFGLYT